MAEKDKNGTPTDLSGDGVEAITSNLWRLLADVFALVREDQELSLAHQRAPLSRLSPAARRTGESDFRHNGSDRGTRAENRGDNDSFDSDIAKNQRLKYNNKENVARWK